MTYPLHAPKIKLAEEEGPNESFFERHPKKILAAGGLLGGVALHRLLKAKGGIAAAAARGTKPPSGGNSYRSSGGGGGGGSRPAPRIRHEGTPSRAPEAKPTAHKAEAPKIVSTPPKENKSFGPRREYDPHPQPSEEMLKRVGPKIRKKVTGTPPAPEAPKITSTPGEKLEAQKRLNRSERLAAHAEYVKEHGRNPPPGFFKKSSVLSFALWAVSH